jgi:hypothetical protein
MAYYNYGILWVKKLVFFMVLISFVVQNRLAISNMAFAERWLVG